MPSFQTNGNVTGVTSNGNPEVLNVDEYGLPDVARTRTGFPKPSGQSLSYWLQGVRANSLLDMRTTAELPESADTVIIGSGMTGTLVAKHLLEAFPNQRVVVLEAREFCSGATGRNAGHCKPDQWRGFGKYEKQFGAEQAKKILDNEQETWEKLVAYVKENNVDCDLWVGDTYDVPITPEVAELAKTVFDNYKAAGGKVDHIQVTHDPKEAARISRCKDAQACYAWKASTLYPWKLTAHVMRENLAKGVNLQTYTTVRAVTAGATEGTWTVATDRGDITTERVVHATNGYSAAVEPSLRGVIRPTPHMCNKVVPPPCFSGSKALQNSYAIMASGGALFSINPRCTADGIVLFGGSNPGQPELEDILEAHPKKCVDDGLSNLAMITDAVKDFTTANFEGWSEAVAAPGQMFDYQWSGIIGRSADGVPFVGALPNKPGQWICAGHHGHGMARIFTAAPALVKVMQGDSFASTGLPDVYEMTSERLERLRSATDFSKVAII